MGDSITVIAVRDADSLSNEVYQHFRSQVSIKRRQKCDSFVRREDSCRGVLGEMLITQLASNHTSRTVSPEDIRVTDQGKPYFSIPDFHFNISHSGSWIIGAVDSQEIGIDIERKRPIDSSMITLLHPEEERYVRSGVSSHEIEHRFFRIWTLKEAYIKAIGTGVETPLQSFCCLPQSDGSVQLSAPNLPEKYIRKFSIDNKYSCAICTARPISQVIISIQKVSALAEEQGS